MNIGSIEYWLEVIVRLTPNIFQHNSAPNTDFVKDDELPDSSEDSESENEDGPDEGSNG